jgi:hypothetical protein
MEGTGDAFALSALGRVPEPGYAKVPAAYGKMGLALAALCRYVRPAHGTVDRLCGERHDVTVKAFCRAPDDSGNADRPAPVPTI